MKAAILCGRERIQIENITPPPLKPGEVRVRVEAALTCGTDRKVFKRGYHARMIVLPAAFGHEFAGVICEVQSPKSDAQSWHWQIGDRVVAANSVPCGECFYCHVGQAGPSQLKAPVFEDLRQPSGLRLGVWQDDKLPGPR